MSNELIEAVDRVLLRHAERTIEAKGSLAMDAMRLLAMARRAYQHALDEVARDWGEGPDNDPYPFRASKIGDPKDVGCSPDPDFGDLDGHYVTCIQCGAVVHLKWRKTHTARCKARTHEHAGAQAPASASGLSSIGPATLPPSPEDAKARHSHPAAPSATDERVWHSLSELAKRYLDSDEMRAPPPAAEIAPEEREILEAVKANRGNIAIGPEPELTRVHYAVQRWLAWAKRRAGEGAK